MRANETVASTTPATHTPGDDVDPSRSSPNAAALTPPIAPLASQGTRGANATAGAGVDHEGSTSAEAAKSVAPVVIPLGARVRFARRIDRVEYAHKQGHAWRIVPDSPGEGVFIGYRYKQTGTWENDGDYESWSKNYYWQEHSRVKVALVVTAAWQGPWTVDPGGLEVIANGVATGEAVDRSRSTPNPESSHA